MDAHTLIIDQVNAKTDAIKKTIVPLLPKSALVFDENGKPYAKPLDEIASAAVRVDFDGGAVALDFAKPNTIYYSKTATAATFTAKNLVFAHQVLIDLAPGATAKPLVFPADWTWLTAVPAQADEGQHSFVSLQVSEENGVMRVIAATVQPQSSGGGTNGWTALVANVADGDRIVQKIVDWTGGTGAKPTANVYVGATGYVPNIANATDIRGKAGNKGGDAPAPVQVANKAEALEQSAENMNVWYFWGA